MHNESAEVFTIARAEGRGVAVFADMSLSAHMPDMPSPLQYTFILGASKNLPSQVVDFRKGKTRQRKSVGVRMPDDPVCKVRHHVLQL
jgi:tRNA A37 threonylcarbamoyladenosine synthetase subunit TsaC/SUA5/YrdC